MSDEIEYVEPTQEHVGQMVEVRDRDESPWRAAKLTALLENDSDNSIFVAKRQGELYSMSWTQARIPRPLTYAERQARCGLKVGDRVKFVRAWAENEHSIEPFYQILKNLGDTGQVIDIQSDGIQVSFGKCNAWYLPYFVLEKIEDRVATRDDIGKQVYINGAFGDIFTIDVIFGVEGDLWRAVIRSGDNRLVYELSNLRVKE